MPFRQTAPKSKKAIALLNEIPQNGVVTDRELAIPTFTKAFIETLEKTPGCIRLREIVARATVGMNKQLKANNITERKPVDRGTTAGKSIFWFPESVTADSIIPPIPTAVELEVLAQDARRNQSASGSMTRSLSPTSL